MNHFVVLTKVPLKGALVEFSIKHPAFISVV
ncbi:hypothetical protein PALI_a6004 [Pseudoalteromonas aliena SW19]|uniref:Uncharacterized protein n=1 Tax=Pseudoalteromonas aliena SW19 TaxID=1314866 RepID=A0ABR9DUT8_9GAMM|nr:hypothetical protein [Pseudoalteromonas aliena SW19]